MPAAAVTGVSRLLAAPPRRGRRNTGQRVEPRGCATSIAQFVAGAQQALTLRLLRTGYKLRY